MPVPKVIAKTRNSFITIDGIKLWVTESPSVTSEGGDTKRSFSGRNLGPSEKVRKIISLQAMVDANSATGLMAYINGEGDYYNFSPLTPFRLSDKGSPALAHDRGSAYPAYINEYKYKKLKRRMPYRLASGARQKNLLVYANNMPDPEDKFFITAYNNYPTHVNVEIQPLRGETVPTWNVRVTILDQIGADNVTNDVGDVGVAFSTQQPLPSNQSYNSTISYSFKNVPGRLGGSPSNGMRWSSLESHTPKPNLNYNVLRSVAQPALPGFSDYDNGSFSAIFFGLAIPPEYAWIGNTIEFQITAPALYEGTNTQPFSMNTQDLNPDRLLVYSAPVDYHKDFTISAKILPHMHGSYYTTGAYGLGLPFAAWQSFYTGLRFFGNDPYSPFGAISWVETGGSQVYRHSQDFVNGDAFELGPDPIEWTVMRRGEEILLFVNGKLLTKGISKLPASSGTDQLWIGSLTSNDSVFSGYIEQLVAFPGALSDSQIRDFAERSSPLLGRRFLTVSGEALNNQVFYCSGKASVQDYTPDGKYARITVELTTEDA